MKLILVFFLFLCNGFTIFLISDVVMLEIIKTAGIGITSITSILILIISVKNKNVNAATAANVITQGTKIESYHKEVDGMKTELIASTKLLGEAVGKAQGKAESRIEHQEDKVNRANEASEIKPVGEKKIDEKIDDAKREMRIENANIQAAEVKSGTIQVDKIDAKEINIKNDKTEDKK